VNDLGEGYVKWENNTVGVIHEDNSVAFTKGIANPVVQAYLRDKTQWNADEFREFIRDRVVSKSRRDIDKILFRCGLVDYDEVKLAWITKLMNPKDLFWITTNENELMEDALRGTFDTIFVKKVDVDGGALASPDGVNIKRYGVSHDAYGIYKKRLHTSSTDVESEIAVYQLSKLLGVRCCAAWGVPKNGDTEVFSRFEYNFATEFIVHARRLFKEGERSDNEYNNLVGKLPACTRDIERMLIIDFITRQTDRHLSNIAVLINDAGMSLDNLYDNGRSLFHEDSEELMGKAVNNIALYASEFGPVGTYLDHLKDVSKHVELAKLVNLDIAKDQIARIYQESGLRGNRLDASIDWTTRAIHVLKKL
jgi:hypothetical protein